MKTDDVERIIDTWNNKDSVLVPYGLKDLLRLAVENNYTARLQNLAFLIEGNIRF